MLTIKCAQCKAKVFKYVKIGKGKLLHCWKERIVEDYSIHDGMQLKCVCGSVIGVDEGQWVKLKQRAFVHTGTKH